MNTVNAYQANRRTLFDTMYAFNRPFTASELEDAFIRNVGNGFHDVDRYVSFQELLLDLETSGFLEKDGAYYRVLLEEA